MRRKIVKKIFDILFRAVESYNRIKNSNVSIVCDTPENELSVGYILKKSDVLRQ